MKTIKTGRKNKKLETHLGKNSKNNLTNKGEQSGQRKWKGRAHFLIPAMDNKILLCGKKRQHIKVEKLE